MSEVITPEQTKMGWPQALAILAILLVGLLIHAWITQPAPKPVSAPVPSSVCPYLKGSIDAGNAPPQTYENYATFC